MKRLYLDHAATTPLRPAARAAMAAWLDAGNPSSLHEEGRRAKDALDAARETIAATLGAEFGEVVFTSGGTEAANLAVVGTALAHLGGTRRRILMSASEHHCVLHAASLLARLGYQVETVPVDRYARIEVDALRAAMADDVLLVAAMAANNELGTVNDLPAIRAATYGALLFVDAVQTFFPHPGTYDADLMAISAHKGGGPKGAGALYIRAGVKPHPLALGGGQERELRAGTENVAAIAAFAAAAAEILPLRVRGGHDGRGASGSESLPRRAEGGQGGGSAPGSLPLLEGEGRRGGLSDPRNQSKRTKTKASLPLLGGGGQSGGSGAGTAQGEEPTRKARDNFEAALSDLALFTVPSQIPRLSGHAHLRFPGVAAETLLIRLDRMGVAASSGAACSSGAVEPSHVLKACGYSDAEAKEGMRFTFGPENTVEEAEEAARRVRHAVDAIRQS